jgi:hypothetical protein
MPENLKIDPAGKPTSGEEPDDLLRMSFRETGTGEGGPE